MKGSTKFWFGVVVVILIYLYYRCPEIMVDITKGFGIVIGGIYLIVGFMETFFCGTDISDGPLREFNIFYWILIVLQKLNKFFDKNLDI